jgi:hypothetical protein
VLFGLMLFMGTRMGRPLAKAVGMAFAFFAVAGVLGSYKYVDNYQRFRDPFMNTLDSAAPWVVSQKESYMGLCSYLDINLLHLLASPTVDPGALPSVSQSDGRGSYPLLMYGTFWYQHIYESINFTGNRHRPFNYLGSVIYMIAVVPTAVFIVGLGAIASRFPKFIAQFDYRKDDDRHLLWKYVIVCFFIANLALLLGTVFKYHVWSIMQSRLLFPSIVGALGAFGAGVSIVSRIRISAIILKSSMLLLVGLFWLYLSSEVGFQILGSRPQHQKRTHAPQQTAPATASTTQLALGADILSHHAGASSCSKMSASTRPCSMNFTTSPSAKRCIVQSTSCRPIWTYGSASTKRRTAGLARQMYFPIHPSGMP